MANIQHIWFDFDGTLYRNSVAFDEAHDRIRYETYASVVGTTDMEHAKQEYEALYLKHGSNSATFMSLGKPKDFWPKALQALDYEAVLATSPEITETIHRLHSIIPISVFTNNTRAQAERLLKHLEIPIELFTFAIFRDDFQEVKPALDGFYKLIEKTGSPPENILYVGDRVDVDIKPANQLGMQTCLLYKDSSEATYTVHTFRDLLNLVAKNTTGERS